MGGPPEGHPEPGVNDDADDGPSRRLSGLGATGERPDSSMNVNARAASTSCVLGRSRGLDCD